MIIIFIGPPASGKGTQSTLISGMFKLPYFSTGDILREASKKPGSDNDDLRETISSGKLASSDLVNKIVANKLDEEKGNFAKGFVLDGYPRNLAQAEFLDKKFPDEKYKVFFFDITYETLLKRATTRFSCAECGAIYNKVSIPLRVENECDMCGSNNFITRDDDNPESLQERWKEYMQQTMPLVSFYNEKEALVKVDATLKKEDITHQLVAELKRN